MAVSWKQFWQDVKAGFDEAMPERLVREGQKQTRRLKARIPGPGVWVLSLLGLLLLAVYCFAIASTFSIAYLDVGEGNYLYTSGRMADGLMIYRDFLSPQPPMHLLVGSVLVRIGRIFDDPAYVVPVPLIAVRIFGICLRLLTIGLMYLLGRRMTQSSWGGFLAATIYALLPIGFWWGMMYESEPLEIFFLLASLWCFLPHKPFSMMAAGVFMALALLTNMTAAPYAVGCLVYLAVRHPKQLFLRFAIPFIGLWAVVAFGFELLTGNYFGNTIVNQVGSYPEHGFWGYCLMKLTQQGGKILEREGGILVLSLLGLALYNRSDTRRDREFLVWYAWILLGSVLYVTKGGTCDYIFSIGEPAVALFAAYFLAQFFHPATNKRFLKLPFLQDTSVIPQVAFLILLAFIVLAPIFGFMATILGGYQYEQRAVARTPDEGSVEKIIYQIQRYSKPGDAILADPFYAFLTRRKLVEEMSELFLWQLKYAIEQQKKQPGEATAVGDRMAMALEARRVPVVVANVSPANLQLLRFDGVRKAVQVFYKPVTPGMKTQSFTMQVFIPKTDEELAHEMVEKTEADQIAKEKAAKQKIESAPIPADRPE
jgi:hypothetical protein